MAGLKRFSSQYEARDSISGRLTLKKADYTLYTQNRQIPSDLVVKYKNIDNTYAITGGVDGRVMFFSRARRDRADGPGRNW